MRERFRGYSLPKRPDGRGFKWSDIEIFLDRLKHLSDSFEYADCEGKLTRLISVTHQWDPNTKSVVLNDYFATGDQRSGQCLDIAQQFCVEAHRSGLIEGLQQCFGSGDVLIGVCHGYAPIFFSEGSAQNWWNGIFIRDSDGECFPVVSIDASLKMIFSPRDGLYTISGTSVVEDTLVQKRDKCLRVRSCDSRLDQQAFHEQHVTVLGLSTDRRWVYSIGFTKHEDCIIGLIHKEDEYGSAGVLFPRDGWVGIYSDCLRQKDITAEDVRLVKLLSKISFAEVSETTIRSWDWSRQGMRLTRL